MIRSFRAIALLCPLLLAAVAMADTAPTVTQPPATPVRPVTDIYFGHKVVDNYQWLENQKSPEVKAWMKAQADYTRATLDSMPGRAKLAANMQRYLDAAPYTISGVKLAGKLMFYRKRARGVSQETLYVRPIAGGKERALLDLNAESTPGHHVALNDFTPSADGAVVEVTLSMGGAETGTGRFYDTATGKQLPDSIDRVLGSLGFDAEGKTFYYGALQKLPANSPPTDKFRYLRTRAHVMGTASSADPVVLAHGTSPDIDVPEQTFPGAMPARHAPYAAAAVIPGVDPNMWVYLGPKSALKTHRGWRRITRGSDKVTDFYVRDHSIYLVSFRDAPNGKLLRLDADHPDMAAAEVIVPPSDTVLTGGTVLGSEVIHAASDALYLRAVKDGYGVALRVPYGADPKVTTIALPKGLQVGSVGSDEDVPGVMLRLSSWVDPGDYYRFDPARTSLAATGLIEKNDIDPTDLVFKEVEVKAKDGTLVPLSIIYRKDTRMDGTAPTIMIGYGAYGDAWTPGYTRRVNAWLERGGIGAVAHVRGGGERGEAWHLAGYKLTKHNTWEDFIACAHYLIDQHYTSSAKLGIWSQSAGGILIGRTITAEPGLVAAAVDGVPLSDTLRFETGANGPGNTPEFGSVKTKEGFEGLYAMGAYYHVKRRVKYPAVLVTAGANDPRVDPWQGAKMAAALQAATASDKPILLRVNYDAGHFADTTSQTVSDWSDIYSFMLWNFGDPDFQPAPPAQKTASLQPRIY